MREIVRSIIELKTQLENILNPIEDDLIKTDELIL